PPRRDDVRARSRPARRAAPAAGGAARRRRAQRHAPRRHGHRHRTGRRAPRPRHAARAPAHRTGTRMTSEPFDLIPMGRVSVDLYPEQIGVGLADVRTFAKSLGGSATNVSVAAARLGHRSAVITKVGDDPFGPYVRRALREFGVDDRWVGTHPTLRTPIVF